MFHLKKILHLFLSSREMSEIFCQAENSEINTRVTTSERQMWNKYEQTKMRQWKMEEEGQPSKLSQRPLLIHADKLHVRGSTISYRRVLTIVQALFTWSFNCTAAAWCTRIVVRLWTAINVAMTQHRNCYLLEYLKQLLPQNMSATAHNDRGVYVRGLDV